MLKILEATTYFTYLTLILYMGRYMIGNSQSTNLYKTYGSLAYILALADGIYILPRVYAILTTGFEASLHIMGWARIGNGIIITIFFLVVYDLYNIRFSKKKNKRLDKLIMGLGITRIILILLPFNKYFDLNPSAIFSLIRFIPLLLLGLLLALIMFIHSRKHNDNNFLIISILTLIGIFTVDPYMYYITTTTIITIISVVRVLSMALIIVLGYKEVRNMNKLSRY